jgi:hypothetical protein
VRYKNLERFKFSKSFFLFLKISFKNNNNNNIFNIYTLFLKIKNTELETHNILNFYTPKDFNMKNLMRLIN